MAHYNQIVYLKSNVDIIQEPILIVGSKMYVYDHYNIKSELINLGFSNVFSVDLESGEGVDIELDITNSHHTFFTEHKMYFKTIICMEVLTYVPNPFMAGVNMASLLHSSGHIIISECFVRKLSKMPLDYWRFSLDGLKNIYSSFDFIEGRNRKSLIRQKDGVLLKSANQPEEIIAFKRHRTEGKLHFLARRLIRKYLSSGIFLISRFFPEQSIYAVATKKLD